MGILQQNEKVILLLPAEEGAFFYNEIEDDEEELDKLCLTDKSIILGYQKRVKVNMFARKREDVIERISLGDIQVVDGDVQVKYIMDDNYGKTLRITLKNNNRIIMGIFGPGPEDKVYPMWEAAIRDAVADFNIEQQNAPNRAKGIVVCSNCGKENNNDAVFCSGCGEKLEIQRDEPKDEIDIQFCPNCGTKMELGFEFCPECGIPIKLDADESEEEIEGIVSEPTRAGGIWNPVLPSDSSSQLTKTESKGFGLFRRKK